MPSTNSNSNSTAGSVSVTPANTSFTSTSTGYIKPAQTVEWSTPDTTFNPLNQEFAFTLDVASTDDNAKCPLHYTISDDGLKQSWKGHTVWCNPPYGRQIYDWVKKASQEASDPSTTIVMLLPSRTDVKWFHEFCYNKSNVEIRFIQGRLKFGGSDTAAPFGNMVVIFR